MIGGPRAKMSPEIGFDAVHAAECIVLELADVTDAVQVSLEIVVEGLEALVSRTAVRFRGRQVLLSEDFLRRMEQINRIDVQPALFERAADRCIDGKRAEGLDDLLRIRAFEAGPKAAVRPEILFRMVDVHHEEDSAEVR